MFSPDIAGSDSQSHPVFLRLNFLLKCKRRFRRFYGLYLRARIPRCKFRFGNYL